MSIKEKTEITIPITEDRYLICRNTELGRSIYLVDKIKGEWYDSTDQKILATSPVGCDSLADALKEMADKIRDIK